MHVNKFTCVKVSNGFVEGMHGYNGFFYRTGELGFQDDKKKIFWYTKAAKAGLIDAQRDLGYSYIYGEGVEEDYEKANAYADGAFFGYKESQETDYKCCFKEQENE